MDIIENFDLVNYNSYRIKSRCRRAFFPTTLDDFLEIFVDKEFDGVIIGRGNNLILSASYYNKDFIILSDNFSNINVSKTRIEALSGTNMYDMSLVAYANGLSGFEYFYDIPSSLGGAIVMNAGSNGVEVRDYLIEVRVLDIVSKKFFTMTQKDLHLSYRSSVFQSRSNLIILEASFNLPSDDRRTIYSRMTSIKKLRNSKQPKEFPNAGSVFKRPEGQYVGPMIESLGLKGFTIGGAQISEKHAGFIVNKGNATGADIIALIEFIKDKVKKEFDVKLEVEQRII